MIGKTLSHYTIIKKLGEGGMGEVYLAEDARLKRKVALKILPSDMASDPERLARFKREAETVASLNHPNIVTLHSVEEADGIHFLTMEWVEGQTLSDMISRGPLTVERVFSIAIPMADALASAHGKGIMHRDLKPANVMVNDESRVKILDFGLAKFHLGAVDEEDKEAPTQALTTEGLAIGTVPYMSPEQVRGETVDQRTDIFSMGIVLYEMVAGKRPFEGKSGADLVSAILRDRPPSVTELKADLPHQLGRLIQRCLEKDPERRFQTAKDVRNELEVLKSEVESGVAPLSGTAFPAAAADAGRPKWLMPAGIAVAVVALIGLLWFILGRDGDTEATTAPTAAAGSEASSPSAAASEREMVVILPFDNLGQAEDEYFAAGISDEINGRLASVSGLGVISRKTAARYADTDKSVQEIGEELGVDYILEGTVRWAHQEGGANRVRIAPELIRVADDSQVWTEIYDREIDDIFEVQSDIAAEVIGALNVTLGSAEQAALEEQPTDNIDAYQAYLKALDLQQNGTTIEERDAGAVAMFERAVELDPNFVEAWGQLSQHHSALYQGNLDRTEERLARARAAFEGAEQVGTDLPETRLARGYYLYYGFRDYDRALEEFEAAATTVPNDAQSRQAIAYIYRRKGDLNATIRNLQQAAELDPQDPNIPRNLASTYRALRRTEDTLAQADRVIALEPQNDTNYTAKADYVVELTGDLEEGRRILEQMPGTSETGTVFGWLDLLFLERDYDGILTRMELIDSPIPYIQTARQMIMSVAKSLRDGPEAARDDLETTRNQLGALLESAPSNADLHQWMTTVLAFLDENDAAINEAKLAVDLTAKDLFAGPSAVENLARTYAWVGRTDEALELIERLLGSAYDGALTIPSLQLDPAWDTLRDDPRFQALIEKHS